MEGSSYKSANEHVQHIEYRQCLEEMFERHDGMQTPHEGYTQHSIAEATPHQRYAQLLDVDIGIYQEIETASIETEAKSAKAMSLYTFQRMSLSQPSENKQPAHIPMSDHWLRAS